MLRAISITLLMLYVGILVGEIPMRGTPLGETTWAQTRAALNWSGDQAHTLVTRAGLADHAWMKWLTGKRISPRSAAPSQKAKLVPVPPPTEITADEEGLTLQDKEALRQILE